MIGCYYCSKKPYWICAGCDKVLCKYHRDVRYHECTMCYFCNNRATGLHDLCNRFICNMHCKNHLHICDPFNRNRKIKHKIKH